jgi:hypothetical protein
LTRPAIVPVSLIPRSITAAVAARPISGTKALAVSIGPTDPISDIPVMMPYDHHQLHEGELFRWDL